MTGLVLVAFPDLFPGRYLLLVLRHKTLTKLVFILSLVGDLPAVVKRKDRTLSFPRDSVLIMSRRAVASRAAALLWSVAASSLQVLRFLSR